MCVATNAVMPSDLNFPMPDKNPTDPITVTSCKYPIQIAFGVTYRYANISVML
jgi:hypothetical protein